MRSVYWRRLAVAVVSGLALILAGCGSSVPPTSGAVAPGLNEKVVTLLGGIQSEPNSWFPITSVSTCTTINGAVTGLMYKGLFNVDSHDAINFSHSLASGITVSHDYTVYTIKLNPKWHWSDGRPVTAGDVAYTWAIISAASQPKAPWTYCADGSGGVPTDWKSVVAKNPTTVVVTTTKPMNPTWFEINGLAQLVPIPKFEFDRYPNMNKELSYIASIETQPSNPVFHVVDGPYEEGTFTNDDAWTMVANPHYSGHKAKIKTLLFEYETSTANEWAQLRRGTFATASIPSEFFDQRHQLPSYYRDVTVPPSYCIDYLVPNMSPKAPDGIGPIFSKLYVRQALQMGIDQAAIVKHLYDGLGVQESGPVPAYPRTQFFDPKTPAYPYNPAKGKALLEKHGWTENSQGVMTKDGKELKFTLMMANFAAVNTNIAELLKQDWSQEGIDATIVEEPVNQVVALTSSQFQMEYFGGYCYGASDPTGGSLFGTGSPINLGSYSSPEMDHLIAETHAPAPASETLKHMFAYEVYAAEQLPVLWMPNSTNMEVIKQGLHGVVSYYNSMTGGNSYNRWTVGRIGPT